MLTPLSLCVCLVPRSPSGWLTVDVHRSCRPVPHDVRSAGCWWPGRGRRWGGRWGRQCPVRGPGPASTPSSHPGAPFLLMPVALVIPRRIHRPPPSRRVGAQPPQECLPIGPWHSCWQGEAQFWAPLYSKRLGFPTGWSSNFLGPSDLMSGAPTPPSPVVREHASSLQPLCLHPCPTSPAG